MLVPSHRHERREANASSSLGLELRASPGCHGEGNDWTLARLLADEIGAVLRDDASGRSYAPLKKLGEGSFAQCIKIREDGTGAVWAAKLLPKRKLTAKQSERFRRLDIETKASLLNVRNEIDIHSELSHPGIVNFEDWFSDQTTGRLVLVLEYCKHGTLRQVMRKMVPGLIPNSAVVRWTGQLLAALAYLHEAPVRVAHRDLNPDNLLVDASLNLRVCDFGLAARLTDVGTMSGEIIQNSVGTVNYISPEVVMSSGSSHQCDLRAADVWSVGVIMHELLVGRVPFELSGRSPSTDGHAEPHLDWTSPLPLLSAHSAALLGAALCRNPSSRPSARFLTTHAFFHSSRGENEVVFGMSSDVVNFKTNSLVSTQQPLAIFRAAEDQFLLESYESLIGLPTFGFPVLTGMTNEGGTMELVSSDISTPAAAEDAVTLMVGSGIMLPGNRPDPILLTPGLVLDSSLYWAHTLAGGDPHGDRRWIAAAGAWIRSQSVWRQRRGGVHGLGGSWPGGSASEEEELSSDGEGTVSGKSPRSSFGGFVNEDVVNWRLGGSGPTLDSPPLRPLLSTLDLATHLSALPPQALQPPPAAMEAKKMRQDLEGDAEVPRCGAQPDGYS